MPKISKRLRNTLEWWGTCALLGEVCIHTHSIISSTDTTVFPPTPTTITTTVFWLHVFNVYFWASHVGVLLFFWDKCLKRRVLLVLAPRQRLCGIHKYSQASVEKLARPKLATNCFPWLCLSAVVVCVCVCVCRPLAVILRNSVHAP